MLDILRIFLTDNAPPPLVAEFERFDRIMQTFRIENYDDDFVDILSRENNLDQGDVMLALRQAVQDDQEDVLNQFNVVIKTPIDITAGNTLMEAFQLIENHDDPHAILNIVNAAEKPEVLFADLVQLTTTMAADNVLMLLESVDPALISLLRVRAEEAVAGIVHDSDIKAEELQRQRIADFKWFRQFRQANNPEAEDLVLMGPIRAGMTIGFPFTQYADVVAPELHDKKLEDMADEYVAISLICAESQGDRRKVIADHIEQYVTDVSIVAQLMLAITNLLQKFNHYEKA